MCSIDHCFYQSGKFIWTMFLQIAFLWHQPFFILCLIMWLMQGKYMAYLFMWYVHTKLISKYLLKLLQVFHMWTCFCCSFPCEMDVRTIAGALSSPKQTILHRYRNEINCTVNQLQLNYSPNVNLLIPRFIKSLCVISIKLNTLTDVPYQMTVGGAFVYVFQNLWKKSRKRFWTTFACILHGPL